MVSNNFILKYRSDIVTVAKEHGMSNIRVFGSMARNDATAGSDIDLLVELGSDRSLLDMISAKHEIEDITHRRVDIVTENSLSPYLREEIMRSAVKL
jgi:predicted nucleotidyltransferase